MKGQSAICDKCATIHSTLGTQHRCPTLRQLALTAHESGTTVAALLGR
ncbi:MAG: hypothetical protein ACTJHU_07020 [Mycetocola sp.]